MCNHGAGVEKAWLKEQIHQGGSSLREHIEMDHSWLENIVH